jgi:flagellar basal-body rod protein FlgG
MIRALQTSATGMTAQQMNIDNIANNLANVNTAGFKRSTMNFQDLIYQKLAQAGAPAAEGIQLPTGMEVGLGIRPISTHKAYSQGVLMQTENPLDIAIEGEGFFQVSMPDGTIAYTRDGSFKIDSEGNMVTSNGFRLEPSITIPQGSSAISIGMNGIVSVMTPGQSEPQEVGRIELANFINPAGLENLGKNLLRETAASGAPTVGTPGEGGFGGLASGFLEASNVDVVKEMVEMIRAQRAYQINSRVIRGADEMLQTVADIKR